MKELTIEEKLKYAKKIQDDLKMKWFDLDFTIRFNNRCLLVNPGQNEQVKILNNQLETQKKQTEKLIEALENDIKIF